MPSLLLLLVACGWFQDKETPSKAPTGPSSLVVVTMDTTRPDRLGAYGYRPALTPTIDKFASEGLRFERAYATVPLTTPSHSSMFTGVYPPRHGVHTNGDAVLPPDIETLAERLQAAGYNTGASVAAFVTTHIWGLNQGFGAYFDEIESSGAKQRWSQERPANLVVDDAVAWLQKQEGDKPFFLWVHLYDPHDPYAPPAEWAAKTQGRPYDGEIAFMDSQIGRLQVAVEAAAGANGAAWILVADHGESLVERHGERRHGLFLYDDTTRIPFILRPAQPLSAAVVSELTVSNVDLMPTALGMLGLPVPEGLDGVDLSPLLRGETMERGPSYMESFTVADLYGYYPEVAITDGTLKLMATPSPRLFDLATDPGEDSDLVAQRGEDVKRLNAEAERIRATTRAESGGGGVSPEVMEKLAALGYMSGGRDLSKAYSSTLDAKDHLDTLKELEAARALTRDPNKLAEAEAAYRAILAKEPQLGEARVALANVLMQRENFDEAVLILKEALAQDPDSTVLHFSLARAYGQSQRFEESLIEFEAILAQVPGDVQARVGALRTMAQLGKGAEALTRGEAWLMENADDPSMQAQVGVLRLRNGHGPEAEALLQASLRDGMPRPLVHEGLARAATARGDTATTELHLKAELEYFPKNRSCRWALANLYATQKRYDDAVAEYSALIEMFPKDLPARIALAQAQFNAGDVPAAKATIDPVLAEAPKNPQALLLKANILGMEGKMAEGEAMAKEAQALYAESRKGQTAASPSKGPFNDNFGDTP